MMIMMINDREQLCSSDHCSPIPTFDDLGRAGAEAEMALIYGPYGRLARKIQPITGPSQDHLSTDIQNAVPEVRAPKAPLSRRRSECPEVRVLARSEQIRSQVRSQNKAGHLEDQEI